MEPILEMAKDLAYAIQQDERYIRTQMAQAAADEDEELQGMIGEFNLKRIAINNETTKDEGTRDGEKLKALDGELREVYARIMQNPNMAAYNAAKTEPYRRHQFHPRPRGPGTGPRQLRGGRLQRQLRRLRGLSLSR